MRLTLGRTLGQAANLTAVEGKCIRCVLGIPF